jgi:hypothetical protein
LLYFLILREIGPDEVPVPPMRGLVPMIVQKKCFL